VVVPTTVMAMSTPPPTSAGSVRTVLALEAARSWRRRRSEDRLVLSSLGVVVQHARGLREPLRLPLGALALGSVEPGAGGEGRFPVLRRLASGVVVLREEGVEGWLWTRRAGSALVALLEDGDAPNVALLFAQPLGEELVRRHFAATEVEAIAARSPLGAPSAYGLLLRVSDAGGAERAFERLGLGRPLTDRDVPPTLRRALPTDRPADPRVRLATGEEPATSVAPPGA
jgi:hypothetical protein